MFCSSCGKELPAQAAFCPACGAAVAGANPAGAASGGASARPASLRPYPSSRSGVAVSNKSRLAALLLCLFLGWLGVHRFYVGKIGTGIVWLLTGGVFGIGWIIDIVMIAVGKFKDKQGNLLA